MQPAENQLVRVSDNPKLTKKTHTLKQHRAMKKVERIRKKQGRG